VTLAEAFNAVTLTIKDLGAGFSTEQITRVGAYMQFDRKMQEQQGLGLGLVIAKRLVQLHGGKLEIVSEKKSGATVSCRFPRPKTG
jgi:signal transduction histidine kinase